MPLHSIMLVEDSELDRDLCEIIIQQYDENIEIQMAEDGAIALDKLLVSAKKPDVILLDINMPNLDGFGFLDRFSMRYNGPGAPAVYVMIASAEQRGDIRKVNTYDCVRGCIEKPLSLTALRKVSTRSATSVG